MAVVNMPRKPKQRKHVTSDAVWIAPRPANVSQQNKTFEPIRNVPSNRYLDFADIALGAKKPSSPHKRKSRGTASRVQLENQEGKVTPIDSRKISNRRGPNQGFGAFRGSR